MSKPAFEPTRNGWSLQAFISFWAFRAQPPLAAQLRRCTPKSFKFHRQEISIVDKTLSKH